MPNNEAIKWPDLRRIDEAASRPSFLEPEMRTYECKVYAVVKNEYVEPKK